MCARIEIEQLVEVIDENQERLEYLRENLCHFCDGYGFIVYREGTHEGCKKCNGSGLKEE